MCGRMNVTDDPIVQWLSEHMGISFSPYSNHDLRPTQTVATLAQADTGDLQQLDSQWGIKPSWSKSLLINAKAETVAEKKTFKQAFASHRCLVPVTGWYEWKDEGGKSKQKYAFTHAEGQPFLMAGIYYSHDPKPQLVTLTTRPTEACAQIHNRMPLLIHPGQTREWFESTEEDLPAFMSEGIKEQPISIDRCP